MVWLGDEQVLTVATALMARRAKNSDLELEEGEDFIGSRYFPSSLISTCLRNDPRGLLFGQQQPSPSADAQTDFDLSRLRGKKLLLCSGADDNLVPHIVGVPFIEALRARDVEVDERVYKGVGHAFSADMVNDAVAFLVDAVTKGPRR